MALEQVCMSVAPYEAKFHALSRYATQLVTKEEERIHVFFKGFSPEIKVLSFQMTFARKNFNKVTKFMKKGERVKYNGQAKSLAKKPTT